MHFQFGEEKRRRLLLGILFLCQFPLFRSDIIIAMSIEREVGMHWLYKIDEYSEEL